MSKINRIWAREILDSRGIPTVEAACLLDDGKVAIASVPSGASTGTYEALELRDLDEKRYKGKGVKKAVENINNVLGPHVANIDPSQQESIDARLIQMDSSPNKTKYGANAILAVSVVVAKAAALANNISLYYWIAHLSQRNGVKPFVHIPTPLFNMINGGLHGSGNLDFQEFHVIPSSNKSFSESLRSGVEIYLTIGDLLERRGAIHSVGDEGGYAPNLFTNADALQIFVESIRETEYNLGRDVHLGIDIAASTFYKGGEYQIRDRTNSMNADDLIDFYKQINDQFHLAIMEDPLYEDDWNSWKKLTSVLGNQIIIVGDDLLVTNIQRVKKAITEKACNAILVKPNQIGTVTETLNVIKTAKDAGWKIIVSHRSGETNDWFIADFAVGVGADYVKFGAPARGERVAKYNRLLSIERELILSTLKK